VIAKAKYRPEFEAALRLFARASGMLKAIEEAGGKW